MACCNKTRAHAKKVAIRKANANALRNVKNKTTPKPAKIKPKKVAATKVKPCTLCGKAARK